MRNNIMNISELNKTVHFIRLIPGIFYMLSISLYIFVNKDQFNIIVAASGITLVVIAHIVSVLINVYYDSKNEVDSHENRVQSQYYKENNLEDKIFPTIIFLNFLMIIVSFFLFLNISIFEYIMFGGIALFYTIIYSVKPFEISKTIFGELYNVIGFGILVMVFIYYIQTKSLLPLNILILSILFYFGAIMIASGLDSVSDATYRKTLAVVIGKKTSITIGILIFITLIILPFFFITFTLFNTIIVLTVFILSILLLIKMKKTGFVIQNKLKIMKYINYIGVLNALLILLY